MIGLTSVEVYNSLFNIDTTNIKFALYTDNFDEFSFIELNDELEEIINISDIRPHHLQLEKIGPRIIEAHKELRSEKSSTSGFIILLMGMLHHRFEILKVILES